MVILAALPGMVRELLVTGKLVKPGNFSATINLLGSRIRKAGLAVPRTPTGARPFRDVRDRSAPGAVRPAPGQGLRTSRPVIMTTTARHRRCRGPRHAASGRR